MRISSAIQIKTTPSRIFALYAKAEEWPKWDPEVKAAFLDHGLRAGSTGRLHPRSGPKAAIRVIDVVESRSFTVESRLPLCRMIFGHDLEQQEEYVQATHWVEFSGPLSFLFRRLIGAQFKASLPKTMSGLKQAAEAPEQQEHP